MASERVVKVTLTAQMQNYLAGMEKARKATQETASEAQKLADTRTAMDRLGRTYLAAGGLIGIGLGVAVAKAAEFDKAMSSVAATGEDARKNLGALRDAAIDAGASTVYSATESANAIENLAKAGLGASDILGGALTGSLDLAAAGGLDVADAAEIAATTLQQFGLKGDKAVHVADLLAAGAGKAMGDVSDMSQALKQAGLVANQFGIGVEETTGTLAAFASAGLLGSDAGTSFRTMLLRLANPTGEVKDLMAELGINAYNAQGQFIGLQGLAGQLEKGLGKLTDQQRQSALATIFGQDAIRAATVLYDEGAAGIAEWTKKVDDSGFAAEMASTKLDNLQGDIEALQGAVDSALITMGSAADGPLRSFVQLLTGVVDGFNELPAPAQQAVFWIGAVTAAGSAAYGMYLLSVPKMAEYNASLEVLGPSAQKVARGLSAVAKFGGGALAGLAGGAVAADLLIKAFNDAGLSGEQLANRVKTATNAVALFDAQNQKTFVGSSNLRIAEAQVKALGGALDALRTGGKGDLIDIQAINNVQRLGNDLADLAKTDLPAAQKQFSLLAEAAGLNKTQQSQLLDIMGPLKDELTSVATANGDAATKQNLLNLAVGKTPGAVDPATNSIQDMGGASDEAAAHLKDVQDALDGINDAAVTMSGSVDAAYGAINDLAKAAEAEDVSIDGLNDTSIAFRDSIRDVEQAHKDAAEAILNNGGTLDEARAKYQEGRDAIIKMLEAKGMDTEAAKVWADKTLGNANDVEGAMRDVANAVGAIPTPKTITLVADASPAYATFNKFIFDTNGRRINLYVDGYVGRQVAGVDVVARADGGAVYGPGTATSDSIPARLSNGEHVLTAADVAAMGGQHAVYAFRESLHGGGGGTSAATAAPSGPATFNLFDSDGVLMGTMRGVVVQENSRSQMRLRNGSRG